MRRMVDASAFVQAVEARKRAVGLSDDTIAEARNSGRRRTPAKRELISRIQERARSAGLEPLAANF